MDDVVREEAPAGWRAEEGVGRRGFRGLGVRMGQRMGWEREPWLRDALVQNVG